MKELSLYIHIPFCVRKCAYCDFLSFSADETAHRAYTANLISEIDAKAPSYANYEIISIFFGGGTPSAIDAELISDVLNEIKCKFNITINCEISIECNPGTVSDEKLSIYRSTGINRISLGLQSANNNELKLLGRIHNLETFEQTYKQVLSNGFRNVNVDLMCALPGQSIESWESTLNYVLSLKPMPTHISAYSLIIEEGTPFYERYGDDAVSEQALPSEEDEREMYKITDDILSGSGFHRYEISNYAQNGYECRHNLVYWDRGDYLGLGLGASSMISNVRFKNTPIMEEYLSGDFSARDKEALSVFEQMEEFMFLGLRKIEGVSHERFKQIFGEPFPAQYIEVIEKYAEQGFLRVEGDDFERVMLTKNGIDVSNYIFADFLFD